MSFVDVKLLHIYLVGVSMTEIKIVLQKIENNKELLKELKISQKKIDKIWFDALEFGFLYYIWLIYKTNMI